MSDFETTLAQFELYLKHQKGYSPYTVRNYLRAAKGFEAWITPGLPFPAWMTNLSLARQFVIEKQHQWRRKTLHTAIDGLRAFCHYWLEQKGPADPSLPNPWTCLTLPKLEKKLPTFMSEKQINQLLAAPMELLALGKIKPFVAWRDRLILELLYAGGLRVSELVGLRYGDQQPDIQALRILGKGNKERMCPIGPVAWSCLLHFQAHYAPCTDPASPIIVSCRKKAITPRAVQALLKVYLAHAKIPHTLTPHKIRHSYATHLLHHGAPLPVLQALLGHSSLAATQVYTHLDIQQLRNIHLAAHPREAQSTAPQTP
jgi:integrase/recombinase XerC